MFAHAQAPVRIGIAGGGTDLPAWTKERIGFCLNLAIKTYTHAVAMTRPDRKVVVSYRQRDVAEAATEIGNGLVRESALMHGFEDGFEIHTLSEVSSYGSGLGVSSSIAVALVACLSKLGESREGETASVTERAQLAATRAWTVEIDRLRRPIGRQDHMAAAFGGLRLYRFEGEHAQVERTFSEEDAKWVAGHLLLVPLSEGHDARAILSSVKASTNLQMAYDAVAVATSAIEQRDVSLLGQALRMGQASKQHIVGAVPSWLSKTAEKIEGLTPAWSGVGPKVMGCKVAGAGGGGHLVVAYEGDTKEMMKLIEEVLQVVPWQISPDMHGVRSEGWC